MIAHVAFVLHWCTNFGGESLLWHIRYTQTMPTLCDTPMAQCTSTLPQGSSIPLWHVELFDAFMMSLTALSRWTRFSSSLLMIGTWRCLKVGVGVVNRLNKGSEQMESTCVPPSKAFGGLWETFGRSGEKGAENIYSSKQPANGLGIVFTIARLLCHTSSAIVLHRRHVNWIVYRARFQSHL